MGEQEMLRNGVKNCKACFWRNLCTSPVPPEGPADAKVMIIGRSPGGDEDKLGRPFVGPGGKCLDRMLQSVGIYRQYLWITNLVKCGPPNDAVPPSEVVSACSKILAMELSIIQPKVVVLLGNQVVRVFFPDAESTVSSHGRMFVVNKLLGVDLPGCYVWWQLHPGYIVRKPGVEQSLIENDYPVFRDMLKKISESESYMEVKRVFGE